MEPALGYIEGETCNRHGCRGKMAEHPVENCSCHVSPPCGACTAERGYCLTCGAEVSDEVIETVNDYVCKTDAATRKIWSYKPRELDSTKIDWHSKPHTHFSMIKEGVYPEGTTQDEVLAQVKGTFGGRFEYFRNGKFKYIAYTD